MNLFYSINFLKNSFPIPIFNEINAFEKFPQGNTDNVTLECNTL